MATAWNWSNRCWPGLRGWPQPRWHGDLCSVRILRLLSRWLPRPLKTSHRLLSRPKVSTSWWTDATASRRWVAPLTSHCIALRLWCPWLKRWRRGARDKNSVSFLVNLDCVMIEYLEFFLARWLEPNRLLLLTARSMLHRFHFSNSVIRYEQLDTVANDRQTETLASVIKHF